MDGIIRMSGMLLVGLVAAAIMNVVLIRLVSRPLQQLVDQVRSIGLGRFDTQNSDFGNTELSFLSSEINAMSASLAASERSTRMRMDKAREIQEGGRFGDTPSYLEFKLISNNWQE